MTGWRLVDAEGRLASDPSLRAAISVSVAPPLSFLLVTSDVEQGTRLKNGLSTLGYCRVASTASLSNGSASSGQSGLQRFVRQIDGMTIDAIAISVRSREDAVTICQLIEAAGVESRLGRIPVLFAGPDDIAASLRENLPRKAELRHVSRVEWFRPDFDPSLTQAAISEDYLRPDRGQMPGNGRFEALTPAISSSLDGLGLITQLLARSRQSQVVVIDGGAATTSIVVSDESQTAEVRSDARTHAFSSVSLGTAGGIEDLLGEGQIERVRNWLPFDIEDSDLRDYLANRGASKRFLPQDLRQILIEQGVTREAGLMALRGLRRTVAPELIIASGGMARQPAWGAIALMLLDIFQPLSPCRLLVDRASMIPRLGAAARLDPGAVISLLQRDTLVDLGVCLSADGMATEGDTIAEIAIEITEELGALAPGLRSDYEIRFGTITRVEIPPGMEVPIRITEGRRMSFAIDGSSVLQPLEEVHEGSSSSYTCRGGLLGLIIDARGRPAGLPDETNARQARLIDWLQSIGAVEAEKFSNLG